MHKYHMALLKCTFSNTEESIIGKLLRAYSSLRTLECFRGTVAFTSDNTRYLELGRKQFGDLE